MKNRHLSLKECLLNIEGKYYHKLLMKKELHQTLFCLGSFKVGENIIATTKKRNN